MIAPVSSGKLEPVAIGIALEKLALVVVSVVSIHASTGLLPVAESLVCMFSASTSS